MFGLVEERTLTPSPTPYARLLWVGCANVNPHTRHLTPDTLAPPPPRVLQVSSTAAELSDQQDQLAALSQQMGEDAAKLAAAEAAVEALQQQLQQEQQPAAVAAAVRGGGSGAAAAAVVDEDLVAELEDRLLEAEQVRGLGWVSALPACSPPPPARPRSWVCPQ